MNRTIWKFRIFLQSPTRMPAGARILHVGEQGGLPHVWAEVNPDAEPEKRDIHVVGTGHPVPEGGEYLGTAHCGPFVWHLYEVST